ncbi:EutP/PduV family microcompartment system protein [Maridesulfovibrio sp.]|uniref:EutP/PduV family microcompartment system protein n=1 Tax=Maridesulfovibrio sp. TaxID=2795000 RepID=UPI002A18749A|nr:EutP/PduV family microcompartment system protein [Maridesulfovibrio sp.]
MKKMMFAGETRCGKSSLIRALSGESYTPRRAMAVEYFGPFINTPGEFLENSWFYHALITSSADCHVLALVQDSTRRTSLFPPLFASMFNRTVLGIVTKTDSPDADPVLAERFLRQAGAKKIIRTSSVSGEGIEEILSVLNSSDAGPAMEDSRKLEENR